MFLFSFCCCPLVLSAALPHDDLLSSVPSVLLLTDFDDTLKVGDGDVGRDSRWIVRKCIRQGYEIALASAGCNAHYSAPWLRRLDPEVWNGTVSPRGPRQRRREQRFMLYSSVAAVGNPAAAAAAGASNNAHRDD